MGANLINHTVEAATRIQIQQVQRLHQINTQIWCKLVSKIQSTMSETMKNVNEQISTAFANLSELSGMHYDYWISRLYDVDGDMVEDEWSYVTLTEMQLDVDELSKDLMETVTN